jgi:hypothetical protein
MRSDTVNSRRKEVKAASPPPPKAKAINDSSLIFMADKPRAVAVHTVKKTVHIANVKPAHSAREIR